MIFEEEKGVKAQNTKDGSKTLFSNNFKEHYHSINGALTESQHIFIDLGFKSLDLDEIKILEIGYGTGLNAICTFMTNDILNRKVYYHGIEKFPLAIKTLNDLNYSQICNIEEEILAQFFLGWNQQILVGNNFKLFKQSIDFNEFNPSEKYDLIYFDAFSPDVQPEMWSFKNLKKILISLSTGGVFVTYSSRGELKRNLRALGMEVKRFSGPPGKRHVIRATKL